MAWPYPLHYPGSQQGRLQGGVGRSECLPSRPCLLSDGEVSSRVFMSRMAYGVGMGATPAPQKALGHEQRSGHDGLQIPMAKSCVSNSLPLRWRNCSPWQNQYCDQNLSKVKEKLSGMQPTPFPPPALSTGSHQAFLVKGTDMAQTG